MLQRLRAVILVLLIAVIGVGVSLTIEHVHNRIDTDQSYVSFCKVNDRVDCDRVLTSSYASLFGVSVSLWATLFYSAIIALAVATVPIDGFARRRNLAGIIFALSVFGLLFSLYMAAVSFGVLSTVCLMCSTLYLVSVALLLASWHFRRSLAPASRHQHSGVANRDRLIVVGGLLSGLVLIAVAVWEAIVAPVVAVTAEQIKNEQPDFYNWYFEKPLLKVPTDVGNSHGSPNAPITIVEFSDFGCGHCAAFDRSLAQVLRSGRQEQVRVVYRHFPLDSDCNPAIQDRLHPNSCLAATAAECAAEQGKFWPYHQLLFENQSRFKHSELVEYAQHVELDIAAFERCLQSDQARQRVVRDATEGARLQVQSTPTLFINDRKIEGALDAQRLNDALTLSLADKK